MQAVVAPSAIIFDTLNMEKVARLDRDVFKMKLLSDDSGKVALTGKSGSIPVLIMQRSERRGRAELRWALRSRPNVDAPATERAEARNAIVQSPCERNGTYDFWIRDPDGNLRRFAMLPDSIVATSDSQRRQAVVEPCGNLLA